MKSKILLKRTLPIIIALFAVVVLALVSLLVTTDKKVPGFSKGVGEETYLVYSNDGVEIKLTKQDVYDILRDQNNGGSTTVARMARLIDADLLAANGYVSAAKAEDINEKVENAIFGESLEDYLEDNEKTFKLNAKKALKTYANYVNDLVADKVEAFINNLNDANGLNAKVEDLEYSIENKTFSVKASSDVYSFYQLEVAKYNYAREQIEKEYNEDFAEYYGTKENEYKDGYAYLKAEYDKYAAAKARFESDLETWKEADKKTRGDKPVKKDYLANYSVDEEPEEVEAPVLVESSFTTLYNKENVNAYYVVLVSYASEEAAKNALLQANAKIEDGKWLNATTSAELSKEEVEDVVVTLYKQDNKGYEKENLITGSKGAYVYPEENDESKFYYTQATLSSKGLYVDNSTNEFENFGAAGINPYNSELSSNIFYIVNKNAVTSWDDYKGDKEYYETAFYNAENIKELLDDAVTTAYINEAMAELRYEAGLLIYDVALEEVYMGTYTSDYEATKKTSKYAVCSYKVNGEKKEITVDQLFEALANTEYGASSFIYTYQYDWMFLEAKNASGDKYNKYFDYANFKNGTALKKCIYDTTDAKEMYEDAKEYMANVKDSFKEDGYYDSENQTGYASSYGWLNFLKDYFYENYNATINSEDDLLVFYIYQCINKEVNNDLKELTLTKWALAQNYMAKTFAQAMNVSVNEFVIYAVDQDGNTVDPINWTSAQYELAKELYDEILNIIPLLEEGEVSTVFSDIVSAFNNADKDNYAGADKNVAGLNYDYTYVPQTGACKTINVSKYRSAGFKVSSTSATISNTTSVDQIKYAGRLLWNSKLSELIKGESITDLIVFDHSYAPMAYNALDDNNQVVASNDNYLVSSTGFVVMVASSMNMSSYFKDFSTTTTDIAKLRIYAAMTAYEELHNEDPEYKSFAKLYEEYVAAEDKTAVEAQVLAILNDVMELGFADFASAKTYFENYAKDNTILYAFPSKVYAQMYLYNVLKVDEDDYVSLSDLYEDYTEVMEDSDATEEEKNAAKDAITAILTKYINNTELNINMNFDEFLAVLTVYCDSDTSSFVSTQITKWFTSYSSGSATLAYGDMINSNNSSISMLNSLLANADKITASDSVKAIINDLVKDQIESAESSFSSIDQCNYDDVKALLEALAVYEEFDFTSEENLNKLFNSSEYASEKALFVEVINNFDAYVKGQYDAFVASDDYNDLTAKQVETLNNLAVAAGLVD